VCILVPGGVQEVLHMRHDAEVLYLKNRLGFVRLALQHGAPLVPAFAFGQCHMCAHPSVHPSLPEAHVNVSHALVATRRYSWSRPGPPLVPRAAVALVSRLVGFCPIMFWGRQGGPLPHRTPVHVVVGSPIVVPHVKDPSREQCQKYLDLFIAAMETLFEQHKRKVPTSIQTLKVI
jgi:1-acyl-sn-glycerol-3-phosphate acyltransferase